VGSSASGDLQGSAGSPPCIVQENLFIPTVVFDRMDISVKDHRVDRDQESAARVESKGAGDQSSSASQNGRGVGPSVRRHVDGSATDGARNATSAQGKENIDHRRVKAARHPLRVQILNVLTEEGPMSPKTMSGHLDQSLNVVSYHMSQVLFKDLALIEIADEIPRRGAIEHVFRIKPEATIGHPDWQKMLPKIMAGDLKASALRTFLEQLTAAAAAVDQNQLDPDDVVGWVPVRVDKKGRRKVAKVWSEAFEKVARIEEESKAQVERDPGQAVTLVVGATTFEAGDPEKNAGEA
jgi:hypothetical protein